MNQIFKEKIKETMEVYVDDMVVKSKEKKDNLTHPQKAFDLLQKYKMKLNPEKRILGLASNRFLGYIITKCGTEANLIRSRQSLR